MRVALYKCALVIRVGARRPFIIVIIIIIIIIIIITIAKAHDITHGKF